ncbi:MAG: gas vesicle protein GvpG [Verrucomicrobiota bacterium]|jgi:Gas vesicle protein G
MFLLDDILLAPLKGVVWLGEKIDEVIKTEELDETRLKDTLLELQMRLELGQISEQEYRRQETALLERMEAIRAKKEEK